MTCLKIQKGIINSATKYEMIKLFKQLQHFMGLQQEFI